MLSAIIMASGFSRRMGKNKLLLDFAGKPLIERVISVIKGYPFSDIVLVTNDEAIIRISEEQGIRTIRNKEASRGQSEALKCGIRAVNEKSDYIFFVSDQPYMDIDTISVLCEAFLTQNKIIVPVSGEKRGNPVLFPNKYRAELLSITGDIGGRAVLKKHKEDITYVNVKSDFLIDIDTVEDYLHKFD